MKITLRHLTRGFIVAALLGRLALQAADTAATEPAKASSYRIQPTDELGISIGGEQELNVTGKKVDSNGNINLLYIPDVHVAGLTVREAQDAIANAYRDGLILRNPQVFVNVEKYAPREVAVSGFVKFPAKVQILPETTLTLRDAISKCGGLSDTANGKNVRVTRTLPDGTIKIIEKLDVESALLGKNSAKVGDANFVLEPNDFVYVPERLI